MNEKENEMLKEIVKDKISFGAFAGMVFNKYIDLMQSNKPMPFEEVILLAIKARRTIIEMASTKPEAKKEEPKETEEGHYEVTCARCGKETTVPFKPKYQRPLYCLDSYTEWREVNNE